jgi:ABC-type multidrug transport system fused ATPase/permease subunit
MVGVVRGSEQMRSVITLLLRLWPHINSARRWKLGMFLVLMLVTSFSEAISISALLPFLTILTAPESLPAIPIVSSLINAFGLTQSSNILLFITIVFGLASIFAGAMRLLLLWATTKLSFAIGADLSVSIYEKTLYQPYQVHLSRNSSEIVNAVATKTSCVITTLLMVLNLISSAVMLAVILSALIFISPTVAFLVLGSFGLIYLFIYLLTRKRRISDSQSMAQESTKVIQILQEGLGGIRDVLLDGTQALHCHVYRKADAALRSAQGRSLFISQSPRYVVEALGMVLIAAFAYFLSQQSGGVGTALPVLGALALGAQRLMPVLQQAYASWSTIQSGEASFADAIKLLEQPLPSVINENSSELVAFKESIRLSHLSFRYGPESPWVLNDITLEIFKGSRVGLIGATGSGKSTLMDVFMGLLPPTEGVFEIDNQLLTPVNMRAWQRRIAHVPQSIFLSDGNLEENIAFGVPSDQVDRELVRQAARQAQIADVIDSWPMKYKTMVGERGVRLSGGQRQRIGIARALYKRADIIIFDEATSALDTETEEAVMLAIEGLSRDLTLILVAHRLTTLKNCTQIVELSSGRINNICSYQDHLRHEKDVLR